MTRSRRVLIVSPSFPPVNAADMHRVRQCLPHLRENGWDATVLAVEPGATGQPTDPHLLDTIPSDVAVERVPAVSEAVTRRFGLGSLALRAYPFLHRRGAALLATGAFDLVFFSTTAFATLGLGPGWARRFGVPFAIDLQDPWRSDYHRGPDAPPPPGGHLKYAVAQALAALQERRCMRTTRHVVSVSADYVDTLRGRYPWLRPEQFTVLPFGAAPTDFDVVGRSGIRQSVFDPRDGNRHWVYVGRGGDDMALALGGFFAALAAERQATPERFRDLRLHFVGTSYAGGGRAKASVSPIAERYGLGDMVAEHPSRIPYFEGLRCLLDAEALIVPGSDDPGYTASKIYPYVLAERPLLAIFHERSSVGDVLGAAGGRSLVTFDGETDVPALAGRIRDAWFRTDPQPPTTDWARFAPYSAAAMTARLCEAFERAVGAGPAAARRHA